MTNNFTSSTYTPADQVDATSVFSHILKNIFSKNFKGGTISNIFGATELDLTQANINGVAVINISQLFGKTTIIIPGDWALDARVSHFCSAFEDDRIGSKWNMNKILIIKGLSYFAAIEIVSIA